MIRVFLFLWGFLFTLFGLLSLNNLKTLAVKNIFIQEKIIVWSTFDPGLVLTGFQTTQPSDYSKLTLHEPAIQSKQALGRPKKHLTSMSSKLEPVIWSRDWLTITWMCNIKEVRWKPKLHVSIKLLAAVWAPFCTALQSCVRAHEQYR